MKKLLLLLALVAACNAPEQDSSGDDGSWISQPGAYDELDGPAIKLPAVDPATGLPPGVNPIRDQSGAGLLMPGETIERLQLEHDQFMKTLPAIDVTKLRLEPDMGLDSEQGSAEPIEKGAVTALNYFAIRGILNLQDGFFDLKRETAQDDCSRFGLFCDLTWHLQARKLLIGTADEFTGELLGACGAHQLSAAFLGPQVSIAFQPCLIPNYHLASPSGRQIPWMDDVKNTCSSNKAKGDIRAAILDYQAYINGLGIGYTMYETSSVTLAKVVFRCEANASADQGSTIAAFRPDGELILRYATAGVGVPGNFVETCESTGANLPGAHPPASYVWSPDMNYSFQRSVISFAQNDLYAAIGSCTSDPIKTRRYIGNIIMHEMGHQFGFLHTPEFVKDPVLNPMTYVGCTEMTTYSKGYSNEYLATIFRFDRTVNGGPVPQKLTIYDQDISCFKPAGY